jgi:hypothetical protein
VRTSNSTAASVPLPISLERRLGPIDGAAIVVSNVIGGGIFFVPIQFLSLVTATMLVIRP